VVSVVVSKVVTVPTLPRFALGPQVGGPGRTPHGKTRASDAGLGGSGC